MKIPKNISGRKHFATEKLPETIEKKCFVRKQNGTFLHFFGLLRTEWPSYGIQPMKQKKRVQQELCRKFWASLRLCFDYFFKEKFVKCLLHRSLKSTKASKQLQSDHYLLE